MRLDGTVALTTLVNDAAATHLVGLPERGDAGAAEVADPVVADTLQTNLWALFWGSRHAIPAMARAGGGSMVNVSSGVATKGVPGMDAYTATKGAMNALTRSMAAGYAAQRIRVNAISRGDVESGETIAEAFRDPARREAITRMIPLPWVGAPEDVAWGCVYRASDESRYVTSTVLAIDGGYLACPA